MAMLSRDDLKNTSSSIVLSWEFFSNSIRSRKPHVGWNKNRLKFRICKCILSNDFNRSWNVSSDSFRFQSLTYHWCIFNQYTSAFYFTIQHRYSSNTRFLITILLQIQQHSLELKCFGELIVRMEIFQFFEVLNLVILFKSKFKSWKLDKKRRWNDNKIEKRIWAKMDVDITQIHNTNLMSFIIKENIFKKCLKIGFFFFFITSLPSKIECKQKPFKLKFKNWKAQKNSIQNFTI